MKLWEHIQEDKYFLQKQHSNRIKFYKLHDKQCFCCICRPRWTNFNSDSVFLRDL